MNKRGSLLGYNREGWVIPWIRLIRKQLPSWGRDRFVETWRRSLFDCDCDCDFDFDFCREMDDQQKTCSTHVMANKSNKRKEK